MRGLPLRAKGPLPLKLRADPSKIQGVRGAGWELDLEKHSEFLRGWPLVDMRYRNPLRGGSS